MNWFNRVKKAQIEQKDLAEESVKNVPIIKPNIEGPSVLKNRQAPTGKIRPKKKRK